MGRQQGAISVHARGFGFLEWVDEGQRQSAFVPPSDLRAFLHGDTVDALIESGAKGPVATRLKLVERGRTTLFGTLLRRRGGWELAPDAEVANRLWPVSGGDVERGEGGVYIGRIDGDEVFLLEEVPEEEVPLLRIRDRYRIRHAFPQDVLDDLVGRKGSQTTGWRDLRNLTTLTIDAPTSRDLDDALSAQPAAEDGAVRVFVHIADVDSVVPEGSLVDLEARQRGTSVYLAGGMSPMLPPSLSEDELSLLPGQDRRVLTAELRIDAEGQVTSIDLYPATIRSDVRCSYEQVDVFLAGDEPPGDLPDEVLDTLSWLRTAASRIAAVRKARGGVVFDRFETRIELDDAMEPVEIHARRQTPAHLLIERLMVAANEGVAAWLLARGLPGLFRVHAAPTAERVDELQASLERMGYTPGLARTLTPRGLAALEAQMADAQLQPVLQEILGQVLDRARYTVHPGEHFGLGSPAYVHFTSPIRRYADLVVHRVIKAYLDGERELDPLDPALEELAGHIEDCGGRAAKAEALRKRTLTARWAEGFLGEAYDGHVVAVKPFGAIVQLGTTGVTGVVPVDSLEEGWRKQDHELVGPDGRLAIGDPIAVRIADVDTERGRIDLALQGRKKKRRRRR